MRIFVDVAFGCRVRDADFSWMTKTYTDPYPDFQLAFERMEIWQLARELSSFTYNNTADMPVDERFGLISQMRRAAVSVAANIAESHSRHSSADKMRFIYFALGSLTELLSHVVIASDVGFLDSSIVVEYRKRICILHVKTHNYRKYIERKGMTTSK